MWFLKWKIRRKARQLELTEKELLKMAGEYNELVRVWQRENVFSPIVSPQDSEGSKEVKQGISEEVVEMSV